MAGLAAKFEALLSHLDERQRRLVLGAEARMLVRGGGRAVARAAWVCEATVSEGACELEAGASVGADREQRQPGTPAGPVVVVRCESEKEW